MATPQTAVHGFLPVRLALPLLALAGLVFLHVWELPRLASVHGGFTFVAAWLLCYGLLGLPLLLMNLLLGRRSRRSPVHGMAYLTREADAPRFWRAAAWGSLLLAALAMATIALLGGGSINFLARDLLLVDGAVQMAPLSPLVLPLGTGSIFILAAGLSLLADKPRNLLLALGALLVLVLLILTASAGAGAAYVYAPGRLDVVAWREALRLALYSMGTGMGLIWAVGVQLDKDVSLGRLAIAAWVLHGVLALLLLFAAAPFVAALKANVAGESLSIVPTGAVVWLHLGSLLLASVLALAIVARPVLFWLAELNLSRLPAVLLTFVPAVILAELVWLAGAMAALRNLQLALGLLLLLVLLGYALFAGWVMKISHARKELALPAEGLYNLWRVAVRIALPLAILWVLAGFFA